MITMFSLELYTPECHRYQDDIGFYVQSCGGEFSVHRHDIEFLIQFPFLKEVPLIY
jgi:hypothetical protein